MQDFLKYFNYFIVFLYVAVGVFFIIYPVRLFDSKQRIVLGIIVILYGLYRGYKLYLTKKKQ